MSLLKKPIRITNHESIINEWIHWNGLSFGIDDFRPDSDIGYKGYLSHPGNDTGDTIGLFFHIDFAKSTIDMEMSYLFGKAGVRTIFNTIKVVEPIVRRDLDSPHSFKSKLLHMIQLLYEGDMEFKKWCISLTDFVPF